jgi:UDP-glucose 4-epimerase
MQALVTGGAGFIGSHIARKLLSQGAKVTILDNLSSGRQENLDACPAAEFVEGDITSETVCAQASRNCDVIFHHAALVSVQESINDPKKSFGVNVQGTLNLLHAARQNGVRRFVFASSAAIYGDDPRLPKQETMPPTPISPYGADKATAEQYVLLWGRQGYLEAVALRYFNVFGPRQDPEGDYAAVIPKFISRLVSGEPPLVFGDGRQTRDFLYVDDVVAANLLAAEHPNAPGRAFNIARGEAISLLGLLDVVKQNAGLTIQPEFLPPRTGDIIHSCADTGLARQELGFAPRTPLADGLKATADYFKDR